MTRFLFPLRTMTTWANPLFDELVALGIVDRSAVGKYYPRVRDREDVAVMRCDRSGVIFLSRVDHVSASYYEEQEGLAYWSKEGREAGLKATAEDDSRRANMLRPLVSGKAYADVGAGLGGVLDLVKDSVREVHAVEPQRIARATLERIGYTAHGSITELISSGVRFDLISLFHVFEHMVQPLNELQRIHEALAPGGMVLIEVPHARDALLVTYDLDAFKRFTFWSEHLVLHTRQSLERYLYAAGFNEVKVTGVQRYPLANHLIWLRDGTPGGQAKLPELVDEPLGAAYSALLDRLDRTDTIIATAVRP